MSTDTTEKGLEELIIRAMTGRTDVLAPAYKPTGTSAPVSGGTGWILGDPGHYNREYCVDLVQLAGFIQLTEEGLYDALGLAADGPTRRKFLARLQGQITKRGVIDVLRNGIDHGPHRIDLFYGTPTPGNVAAEERFRTNRFTVSRQLRYSRDETKRALDFAIFINGLPIATFELKNSLTRQTVADAVEQYKRDRDPREKLFEFGRCVAHFAVDDAEVKFCTHLKGKASWFLPFNKGHNDGAGNPPNPHGMKTDFLWKEILTPAGLTDILENYAQVVVEKDPKTGKKKPPKQIFPRFHQLSAVRKLLADAREHGPGRRYLIQHSAGSGKSNSIAWLAHQLIRLQMDGRPTFDSIIVVTDRRILDQQIRSTIKQFAQVGATIGAVGSKSGSSKTQQLKGFLESGKKIIISTIQTFPFVLDEIGNSHRGRTFAILIDEAHSSQGGRTAAKMSMALSEQSEAEEETYEDKVNRIMETRKMLPNASYFAFTATPKSKTVEMFGEPVPDAAEVKRRPFHSYTMKQAIQEGFILDVLRHYTPITSYYKLVKTVEADPEFDTKRASKKLRRFVESNEHAIRLKAEIMVYHFHEQVISQRKIAGQARAMVVTNGIERAIQYFRAIREYLEERKSPYKAVVAFSGEPEFNGAKVTEASENGFPSNEIADKVREDPYRFLICADKFQTGYDEPLLHTMYVDKALSGIKAVQTLSRLNRAHPGKNDVFVLDFFNDAELIEKSFEPFYRTTVLSGETDPNKLNDLSSELKNRQVFNDEEVRELVDHYLRGEDRDKLDPILDACVERYKVIEEDEQVDFKGKAKAFVRTYGFLGSILRYSKVSWEELSIFLNFLLPKLPSPKGEDLSKGILDAIDMESYRVEKKATRAIILSDEEGEIAPPPEGGGGGMPKPEMESLSSIIKAFNDLFGNIAWEDADRVQRMITEEIPKRVAEDPLYKNARRRDDPVNARVEHDKALQRVLIGLMKDDTQLFKKFTDDHEFKRWLSDSVFQRTYGAPNKSSA